MNYKCKYFLFSDSFFGAKKELSDGKAHGNKEKEQKLDGWESGQCLKVEKRVYPGTVVSMS
jgi:hypothetical protein